MLSFCLETHFEGHGFSIFGAMLFVTHCHSKVCYLLHDILHVYIKYSHPSEKKFGSFSVHLPKIILDGLDILGQQFTSQMFLGIKVFGLFKDSLKTRLQLYPHVFSDNIFQ